MASMLAIRSQFESSSLIKPGTEDAFVEIKVVTYHLIQSAMKKQHFQEHLTCVEIVPKQRSLTERKHVCRVYFSSVLPRPFITKWYSLFLLLFRQSRLNILAFFTPNLSPRAHI